MSNKSKIWSLTIRLFHWSFATLFLLNFWVLDDGDPPHEWAGYVILALLIFRFIWGFIGPINERFISFIPTVNGVKEHLNKLKSKSLNKSEGHNPAGALMIYALLITIFTCATSGWMLEWDMFWGSDVVEGIHESSANIAMGLVVVHIFTVIAISLYARIDLVGAMITGKRKID